MREIRALACNMPTHFILIKRGDIMYIWIGLVFNKKEEEYIRNICKKINENYNLSEVSYTLPQHIFKDIILL